MPVHEMMRNKNNLTTKSKKITKKNILRSLQLNKFLKFQLCDNK